MTVMSRVVGLVSPSYRFRSAVTGMFVSKAYALIHPATTVRERVDPEERDAAKLAERYKDQLQRDEGEIV